MIPIIGGKYAGTRTLHPIHGNNSPFIGEAVPENISAAQTPTPWNPFAVSSFAPLTDPLAPLVEIFSPFPTFGRSLLSVLQPLRGPSSFFVPLRGYLFSLHCLSGGRFGRQAPFNSGMVKRPSTRVTKGSNWALRSSSLISRRFSPGRTSAESSSNSNSWLSFKMIPANALGSG